VAAVMGNYDLLSGDRMPPLLVAAEAPIHRTP
jgi:hypothetical protein